MKIFSEISRKRWLKHAIGFCITLICLVVFIRQIKISDILEALATFQWPYIVLGIFFLAIDYLLRITRWTIMLKATGAAVTIRDCVAPFLGSIALNNILPLRLGDVVRALVFPRSMGISKAVATSSLIIERLIDLMTLLASLAFGLFAVRTIAIPADLKATAVTLAVLGGLILAFGFFFSGMLERIFGRIATKRSSTAGKICFLLADLLRSFNAMSRLRVLVVMFGISMLVWIGEAGLFYCILLGSGIQASPLMALFVMALVTLSTLLPSSPGYVGPFHLAAFGAIILIGGSTAQAGSYAVVVHLALWLPTTLAGAMAIWVKPELFQQAKSQTSDMGK